MNRQHTFWFVYRGLPCNFPHFHANKKRVYDWYNAAFFSLHLEALGRDKHAYFVHFTLYFPVLIFSCLNFPLLGLNFRI